MAESNTIRYLSGYKYQLLDTYKIYLIELLGQEASSAYLTLDAKGYLHIRAGYAWDGPSGPTYDTKTFMRGSLIHDALYQLIREKLLPLTFREEVDQILFRICRDDGMWGLRARSVLRGVRIGGHAAPTKTRIIYTAP